MKDNKFRAWDTFNKIWLDPKVFSIGIDDGLLRNKECNGIIGGIEIVQYTGYKAENGELYEGDLINDNMEVYWNYNCNAWAVREFGSKIIFALLYKFITNCDEDNIKIFGNIYERNSMGER